MKGGKREGAGRKKIDGQTLKIKIPDETYDQLNLFFPGATIQDRIRNCLEYGLESRENMKHDTNKPTVVDLFCGAGGLSRGFLDAGFNVVLGIDSDDAALETFKKNHGQTEVMNLDLFDHENLNIAKDYLTEKHVEVDVLVGGPPCQGFSLAGPRNVNDERNTLYTAMVKFAEMINPKIIVMENVPGLVTLYEGKAKNRIEEDFSNLGYKMQTKILYAPEYGIPQTRKRVFFVGVKPELGNFEFPKPFLTEVDYVTSEDAISDLPSLEDDMGEEEMEYPTEPLTVYQEVMRKNSDFVYNHIGTQHIEKTIKMISMVPEGGNYKDLPSPYNTMYKYNEALTRYHSKKPSNTINTGHRSHFHYKYNRIPTVRESARLQSFTDDFIFYGNKTKQYAQVGNAVPPMWGKLIATEVLKILPVKEKSLK